MRPAGILLLVLVLSACGGTSYTQDEVDSIVAEAVEKALAEERANVQAATDQAKADGQAARAAAHAAFVDSVEECLPLSNDRLYVAVDEGGMSIEGMNESGFGLAVTKISCILRELNTPESVLNRISNTNSLMGVVEGEWGEYQASWTYHPDNGLFIHIAVRVDD